MQEGADSTLPEGGEAPQTPDVFVALRKVSRNGDAAKILASGREFVGRVDLPGMLGLGDPLETNFITHLVADHLSRDGKPESDVGETEGEKIFKEFLESERGFVIKNLGEERTRTIEDAVRAILTSGLGKDTAGRMSAKEEDLQQWTGVWRKRLEENPPTPQY